MEIKQVATVTNKGYGGHIVDFYAKLQFYLILIKFFFLFSVSETPLFPSLRSLVESINTNKIFNLIFQIGIGPFRENVICLSMEIDPAQGQLSSQQPSNQTRTRQQHEMAFRDMFCTFLMWCAKVEQLAWFQCWTIAQGSHREPW